MIKKEIHLKDTAFSSVLIKDSILYKAGYKRLYNLKETAGAAAKLYTVDNPELNVDWRPTVQGLFLQHGVIRDPKKGRLTCCMGLCEADIAMSS